MSPLCETQGHFYRAGEDGCLECGHEWDCAVDGHDTFSQADRGACAFCGERPVEVPVVAAFVPRRLRR